MSRQVWNRSNYLLENGKLQSYAWPGGYPLFYIVADNGVLCPSCANSDECQQAIAECPDDKEWLIVAADINYEDSALYCDHCNQRIESAYADDDDASETDDTTAGEWSVIVGNIGTVTADASETIARQTYTEYVAQSKSEQGRAGGEDVYLLQGDHPVEEFHGSISQAEFNDSE